jgi:hypothetical protein
MIEQVTKWKANGRLFDTEDRAKEELSWGGIRQRAENIDALCMEHLADELDDEDFRNYFKEFIRLAYADLFPNRDVVEAEGYRLPVALVPKFLGQVMGGFVESDKFMSEWAEYRIDEEK